ncbi:hypothetical protein HK105_205137 [Polyrhizophydium stewartii]|uniref:Uncharacterized protein n=1 Tax=Polyrhizophydium stewartii TaxID=2732419 RepID=A0ABR4N6W4_9FUNG
MAAYLAMQHLKINVDLTTMVGSLTDPQKAELGDFLPNNLNSAAIDAIAVKTQGSYPPVIQASVVDIQRMLVPEVGRGRKSTKDYSSLDPDHLRLIKAELDILQQVKTARYTHMRCGDQLALWLRSLDVQCWSIIEVIQAYCSLVYRVMRWLYKRKFATLPPSALLLPEATRLVHRAWEWSPHDDEDDDDDDDDDDDNVHGVDDGGLGGGWAGHIGSGGAIAIGDGTSVGPGDAHAPSHLDNGAAAMHDEPF